MIQVIPEVGQDWKHEGDGNTYRRIDDDSGARAANLRNDPRAAKVFFSVRMSDGKVAVTAKDYPGVTIPGGVQIRPMPILDNVGRGEIK